MTLEGNLPAPIEDKYLVRATTMALVERYFRAFSSSVVAGAGEKGLALTNLIAPHMKASSTKGYLMTTDAASRQQPMPESRRNPCSDFRLSVSCDLGGFHKGPYNGRRTFVAAIQGAPEADRSAYVSAGTQTHQPQTAEAVSANCR